MSDGGPAFPCPVSLRDDGQIIQHPELGMMLRDYFAASALTGIIASPASGHTKDRELVNRAWKLADAMLAVRERKGVTPC